MQDVVENREQKRPSLVLLIGIVLLTLSAGVMLFRWQQGSFPFRHNYHSYLMQSPAPMSDFELTNDLGGRTKLSDLRGKVTLLYFGYTYCPDVCPATLSDINKALKSLKSTEVEQLQVVMVTIDPERDSAEKLHDYLSFYNPTFIGLTGTPEEIAAAATPLGIYYQKVEVESKAGYLLDHTATVSVLDRDGYLRLVIPFNMPSQKIAEDLRGLLRE